MRVALLAFVAGCWLLQQQGGLPDTRLWLWLAGACAVGVLACMVLVAVRQRAPRIKYVQWCLAAATVGMIGFGWAAWRAEVRIDRWLAPEMAGMDLVVEGIVAGLPDVAEHGTRFVFNAERWREDLARRDDAARGQTMPKRLLLTWREKPDQADRVQPGQRYRLTVRLRRPRGLANPHGFDYGYWLLAEGIDATGYARTGTVLAEGMESDDAVRPIGTPWAVRVAMWRADIRDHLRAVLAPDARYGPVLIALVIGDQRGIAQADWEIFRRTGISHLVSISGLHITMIAGAAGGLARWLWRHSFGIGRLLRRPLPLVWPAQHAALVVTVLAAFGYGLVAGMQIPALRTVTMLTVAAVALWGGRAPPVSVVLAWAAAVAVAIDPWAVMSPGFWLSFGAVAVIFLHAHDDALARDEHHLTQGDGHRKPRRLMRMRAGIVGAARTQWAVTIGLVPLTLLLFGQVSVVSGLANAAAIPVVSLLVTPLALAGAVLPEGLARMALGIAHGALHWLVDGLAWLAAPTWAVWEAAHPRWWMTALALLGVVVALLPGMRRLPRWCGGLLMVPMLLAGRAPVAYGEIRVTALDIGQGNAVLVETGNHVLLYDTGPAYASGASAGGQVIVPYLRAAGIRTLDMLMISHEDADHAGGVRDVLRAVPVSMRLTAAPLEHRMLGERGDDDWLHCVGGAGWDWDGVRFDILHPSADELSAGRLRSNARSCVLRIATAHRSVLLTGDIGEREELRLVEREAAALLRADILLVPHHGSGTSSHAKFLRAVQPEMAIFQLGFANRYRHPRADVWQRYERAGIARYRTDETGALSISTHGNAYQVVPYRQQNRRYWRDAPPAPR